MLATQLPEPESYAVWDEALTAAREVADDSAKAQLLIRIATELPEQQFAAVLREAFGISAAMQSVAVEPDQVEWIETLAAATRRVAEPARRNQLFAAAVPIASAIDRPYDAAKALLVLVPWLAGPSKDEAVLQALETARTIDGFRERAQIFTALIPMLEPRLRDEAIAEALTAIRESDWTQLSATGRVNLETGVIEFHRAAPHFGGRASALLNLALCMAEPERSALIREAFEAVYEMRSADQRPAITSLAPHLSEAQVRKLIADITSLETDPWRESTLLILLAALAAGTSEEVALNEARAIYGQAVPDVLTEIFDELTAQQETSPPSTEETTEETPQQFSGQEPSAATEEEPAIDDGDGSRQPARWTLNPNGLDLEDLYRVGDLVTITIDPDDFADQEQRQQILDSIFTEYMASLSEQLPQEKLRDALAAAQKSRSGFDHDWRQAMTALLTRLASLGFVEDAVDEAESAWGWPLPVEAAAALAPHLSAADRATLLHEALTFACAQQDGTEPIAGLAALVRQSPEPDRALAATMVRGAIKGMDRTKVASVATDLSILPCEDRLVLWQETLQVLSTRTRRDLLADLPALLTLIEDMVDLGFWSELADSLGTIRQWWP